MSNQSNDPNNSNKNQLPKNLNEAKAIREYGERWHTFQKELAGVLNANNIDGDLETPDFILAQYLTNALVAYNGARQGAAEFRGEQIKKG